MVTCECVQEFRCDAHVDCLDGSDEVECGDTTSTSSTSTSTTAAPDTAGATCPAPALRCDNATRCVPLQQLCDNIADCADGADEADRCGKSPPRKLNELGLIATLLAVVVLHVYMNGNHSVLD